MIAIQRVNKTRYSPNILPCRINHDGPVNAHARYWSPKTEPDGTRTTYVRGRQLRGRVMRLPKGYSGAVVRKTNKTIVDTALEDEEENAEANDLDEEEQMLDTRESQGAAAPTAVMDEVASFDHITLWSHDVLPDAEDNPYKRGVEEWIAFASAMHSYERLEENKGDT